MDGKTETGKTETKRFIEIDFLKGLAIISMVIFHYFYLSTQMKIKTYNCRNGILKWLAKFAHLTFITVSGLNLAISTSNKKKSNFIKHKLKRGLHLIIIGLIISYLTKIEFGSLFVKFGIMHFIGTATIISSFYADLPNFSMILSLVIFLMSGILSVTKIKYKFLNFCSKSPLFCFIMGIFNVKYNSMDHFSIIPYLGYFSLGIGLAYVLYNVKQKSRKFSFLGFIEKYKNNKIIKMISWLGKNSLSIYTIHFLALWAYFKIQKKYLRPLDNFLNDSFNNKSND